MASEPRRVSWLLLTLACDRMGIGILTVASIGLTPKKEASKALISSFRKCPPSVLV
jgi:hypothetical protein